MTLKEHIAFIEAIRNNKHRELLAYLKEELENETDEDRRISLHEDIEDLEDMIRFKDYE